MAATTHIEIKGQAELERAFLQLRTEVLHELKPAIVALAEPVRSQAEANSVSTISNIGGRWSRMRVGVITSGAYIAPKTRPSGRGSARPNLASELLEAMEAALDSKEEVIVAGFNTLVDASAASAGFF